MPLAEGAAVRVVGEIPLALVRGRIRGMLVVDETAIEQAIARLCDDARIVAEGAGALPLAGLMSDRNRFAGQRVGLVISGGNIEGTVLAAILARAAFARG